MKRALLPIIAALTIVACQQNQPFKTNQLEVLGSVELTFDLQNNSAKAAFLPARVSSQALLSNQNAVSFSSNQFQAITSGGSKFLVAKFNVSNTSGATLNDLTLVAEHQLTNQGATALKNVQNFQNINLTTYAESIKPAHAMSNATTVLSSEADTQFFTETEVAALETQASSLLPNGEYLFPYGYVARATGSSASRAVANGSNTGTLTVGVQIPDTNEPVNQVNRFSMTFIAFTQPTVSRVSESLEEQISSGAETRATGFSASQIAVLSGTTLSTSKDVTNACRVRTAGSSASPTAFLAAAPSTSVTTLDQCFGTGGKRDIAPVSNIQETLNDMIVQADNKIVLVGSSGVAANATRDWIIVRLNPDGSYDRTFGTDGIVTIDFNANADVAFSVIQQADGKLLVGGYGTITSRDFAIVRLETNGTLDTTFATNGKYTRDVGGDSDQINAMTLQTVSGTTYVVATAQTRYGGTDALDIAVFRLNLIGGTLDTTFATGGTYSGLNIFVWNPTFSVTGDPNDTPQGIALDSSNKIIIGGGSSNYDVGVARLNTNGTLDTTFSGDGIFSTAQPQFSNYFNMLYQNGNVILVGCVGTSEINMIRFNMTTPALDTTFGTSGKFSYTPNTNPACASAASLDSSGKILVAGFSATANSNIGYDSLVARLSAGGIADTTFSTSPSNGIVSIPQSATQQDQAIGIATDSSGKIVIAGYKTISATDNDFFVLRINP